MSAVISDTRYFCDIKEFVEEVADIYLRYLENEDDIAILAKYDEAAKILKELCCYEYPIASLEIYNPDFGGYDDEYIINLNSDGIWCQPAKIQSNNKSYKDYVGDESTILYVLGNCNSRALKSIQGIKATYEVVIGDEDDEFEDDELDEFEDKHNIPETKSSVKASYKVNGKEVSKAEFEKFADDIEDKYSKAVHDFLIDWCEVLDELNEWRKLFSW
jgi:hypothetical protein